MLTLTINDQKIQIPKGTTILHAAESAGITIPTLCDHKDLSPFGGCRMCVVEVQGARLPQTACTLEVTEGMVVRTETPALVQSRRFILELLLSNYFDASLESEGEVRLPDTQFMHWVKHYGVDVPKVMSKAPRYPVDSDPNPFIRVDLNKCIQCTRCVRACAEIQGRYVWNMAERGFNAHPVPGAGQLMLDARCESCGACVAYCPTGALDNKMSAHLGEADRLVTTTCTYCGVGCSFDLNVKDDDEGGHVIRVTSNPEAPVNGLHMCVKGRYGYDFIHHPERLTRPLVRRYLLEGDGQRPAGMPRTGSEWVPVDWDTALDLTARKLSAARDTFGPDSVGVLTSAKCTNEENYLMNKFARQVVGTNNIDHCARL